MMIVGLSEYPGIPRILRHRGAFATYIRVYVYMHKSRDNPTIVRVSRDSQATQT